MARDWAGGLRAFGLMLKPAAMGLHPSIRRAVAEEQDRASATDSAIRTLCEQIERADEIGSEDLRRLANLALYICLFWRDQGVLKMDWLVHTDPFRRGFIARQWVTLLWDVADKIRNQAFGKDMRETFGAIAPSFVPSMNAANSKAAQFWKKYGGQLKVWRNVAAAHRDFDAYAQLEAMGQIDLTSILPIAADFSEVTRPTVTLLTEVLENMTVWEHVRVLSRARNSGSD